MRQSRWIRDVFFVGCLLGGIGSLFYFLLSSDQRESTAADSGLDSKSVKQVISKIDMAFQHLWEANSIEHAQAADRLTVARRMALGLTGTLPSVEEIRQIERRPLGEQLDWYAAQLLSEKRTSDYLAERLARAFVGVEEGPFVVYRRRRFVAWLSEQIYNNRPYDQLVHQLLTEDGLWTDSPAVNFYTANIIDDQNEGRPDAIRLAARTSRAFLGMRIDCLQCHDDFLGTINLGSEQELEGGQQLHFHSLASHFSQVQSSFVGIRDSREPRPYSYKLLDSESEQAIEPAVPFNRHLASDQSDLRDRLAAWVTHPENRPFARAAVNRMWAVLFGRGLVDPVDQIPLSGPFPPAMEILADDFIQRQFNLQRLIRVIIGTQVFQLDSQATFSIDDQHIQYWGVFPLVRLRPDQVAGSIIQSTSLSTIDSAAHVLIRLAKYGNMIDFVDRFGDPGEDEFTRRGETVTQRLLLLNGTVVKERLDGGLNSPLRIGALSPDAETALRTVYLACLTRHPSDEELAYFLPDIQSLSGDELARKLQDVYWTLINSVEFVWNH